MTEKDVQVLLRRMEQLEMRLERLERLEHNHAADRDELMQRLIRIETQVATTAAMLRYGLPIGIAFLGLLISVLTYLLEKALT